MDQRTKGKIKEQESLLQRARNRNFDRVKLFENS